MRVFLGFFAPMLGALYLIDKYQFDGHHTRFEWTESSGAGQQYG